MGLLVAGYIPSAAHVIVPQVLKYCREIFPNVELDLRCMLSQHQFDALLSQKIDIGILRPWRRIKGLATRQIVSEPFVVAVPQGHPLAGQKNVSLKSFSGEDFIMHARQIPGISLTYDLISRLFEDAGFVPRVALESPEEIHLTLGMVRAGFGLTVVTRSTMLMPLPGIQFVEIREQSRLSEIAIGWRADRDDARVTQLAERTAESLERDLWNGFGTQPR